MPTTRHFGDDTNHKTADDKSENLQICDVESDDENMQSIEISDGELEDDFEDILKKTAREHLSLTSNLTNLPSQFSHPYACLSKHSIPWHHLNGFEVFNKHNTKTSTSSDTHFFNTKSGYQVYPNRIPVTSETPYNMPHKKLNKKKSLKLRLAPSCHHILGRTHKCPGCAKSNTKNLDKESEKLMYEILRHPGNVGQTKYRYNSLSIIQNNIYFNIIVLIQYTQS